MTIVLGSSALVWLARIGRFDALADLQPDVLVADRTYRSLTEHSDITPEARRVERASEADLFRTVRTPTDSALQPIRENPNLGERDAATLALAHDTEGVAVVDEPYTRRVARVEGIETRSTVYLFLVPVKRGDRQPGETLELVETLLASGWRPTPENYASIIRTLDVIS